MSYLEELLPEFRKGAKIRCTDWEPHCFVYYEDGIVYDQNHQVMPRLNFPHVVSDNWELYQETIDWDYITKNKCLCWFWDNDDKYKSIEKLACINDKADYPFENIRGAMYRHCHPVLKDEVTFYEDKNNE